MAYYNLTPGFIYSGDETMEDLSARIREVLFEQFKVERHLMFFGTLYEKYASIAASVLHGGSSKHKGTLFDAVMTDPSYRRAVSDVSATVDLYPPLSDGRRVGYIHSVEWEEYQTALVESGLVDTYGDRGTGRIFREEWEAIEKEWDAQRNPDGTGEEIRIIVGNKVEDSVLDAQELDFRLSPEEEKYTAALILRDVNFGLLREEFSSILSEDPVILPKKYQALTDAIRELNDADMPVTDVPRLTVENVTGPITELPLPTLDTEKLERVKEQISNRIDELYTPEAQEEDAQRGQHLQKLADVLSKIDSKYF